MCRDDECGVLVDVAGGFLGTGLYDEGAEATEIYVLAMSEAVLNYSHELLNDSEHGSFVDTCCLSYFANYICFSHIISILISFLNTKLLKIGQLTLTLQNELIT